MPDSWQQAYDKLKDYIVKNPSIEIGTNVISISSALRPEFYRLFNTVSASFIKDNLPLLLEKSYVLSKQWAAISQAVKDSLKLEAIDVAPGTRWFLLDPNDGLTRGLLDPLFDLLKGREDLAAFAQTAARVVEDEFTRFSREGYQYWAIMSLLKLLSTDKVYHLPVTDFDMNPSLQPEELYGTRQENVPDAVETNKISFVHSIMYSFLVPKVIGHSTRLNLFTAFCCDFNFAEVRWRAQNLSPEQEWYGVSDIMGEFGRGNLWPDIAIYTGEHRNELVVIADYFQMARPDIIVEFRIEKDWYEKEGLGPVRRHYNVLKPKLGSFVVCREPVPEAALKELESKPELQPGAIGATPETTAQPALDIHLLSVGYDITKLEPILESIIKAQTKPKETTVENAPAGKH